MNILEKFKELSWLKKLSICLGVIVVLFLLFVAYSSITVEYDSGHVKELSGQYESYGLYVDRYHAWANSIYNNDSEPANLTDVLSEDAIDAINEMNEGGMSVKEITDALNEPVKIDYEQGIVDSPTLFDEDFVKGVIGQ